MQKRKPYLIGAVIVFVILGLFIWSRNTDPVIATWRGTDLKCLQGQAVVYHVHPRLTVLIDGEEEVIPGNIGVSAACMAELHTHDATGTLHVEPVMPGRDLTLGEFFAVWGQPFERQGYEIEMTVDGEPSDALGSHVLREGQRIVLTYTSSSTEEASE